MKRRISGQRAFRPGLRLLLGAIMTTGVALMSANAQTLTSYPTRPIKVVVGFAAGGPADIIARTVAAKLSEILGQQVYIENKLGASGNIATEYVAHSAPDGYTLMIATPSTAVNESLFTNFPVKVAKDFVTIAPLAGTSLVLVVHPSLNVKDVAGLISYAKAHPDDLLYATAGKGTSTHLAAELFNIAAGIKMTPVHYKGGGETIKDLLSGQEKVMFSSIPPVLGFVKNGQLIGLATTGDKPDPALPDLPTIAQAGVAGFNVWLWTGLLAPQGTPPEIVDRLAAATEQALEADDVKATLAAQGNSPMYGTPQEFATYYRREAAKFAKLIPAIGTVD